MEEKFFFQYHMHMNPNQSMKLPIYERKWIVDKFIQQKEKENEAIESARRSAKKGK